MAGGGIETIGFDFISNIIGQVVTILAAIFTAARWIDKRNQDKIEQAKKDITESIEMLRKNSDMVKQYIERDINRLENTVENLRLERGDSMAGNRRYGAAHDRRMREESGEEQ